MTGDAVDGVGVELAAGVVVVVDALEPVLDLRAQGGRSDCARALTVPATVAARHSRKANWEDEIVGRIELLRCRFRNWRIGRPFAIGPDGAVFEIFLFPDGDGALESVDGVAASVESGQTMGSADGDEHAGFANFEAA